MLKKQSLWKNCSQIFNGWFFQKFLSNSNSHSHTQSAKSTRQKKNLIFLKFIHKEITETTVRLIMTSAQSQIYYSDKYNDDEYEYR